MAICSSGPGDPMTAHPSTTFLLFHPAGPCNLVSRCPPSRSTAILQVLASPNAACPLGEGPRECFGARERRRRKLRNRYRTVTPRADCHAIIIRRVRALRGPPECCSSRGPVHGDRGCDHVGMPLLGQREEARGGGGARI